MTLEKVKELMTGAGLDVSKVDCIKEPVRGSLTIICETRDAKFYGNFNGPIEALRALYDSCWGCKSVLIFQFN